MTILGIGNDIIEIQRIAKNIERYGQKFLDRIFTPLEQAYCLKHRDPARNFAGRFAAKEAVVKAFGTGFGAHISWTDIEIINAPSGKPYVHFSTQLTNKLPTDSHVFISISHCQDYATAFALWADQKESHIEL